MTADIPTYWATRLNHFMAEATEQQRTIARKRREHNKRGKGDFRLSKKDREDLITIDQLAAAYRSFIGSTEKFRNAAAKTFMPSYAAKLRGRVIA